MKKKYFGLLSRLLAAALCSMLVLAFSGCSRGSVEVKNTVTAYTKMLAEALAKPDAELMEYFTTSFEKKRIQSYIDYLRVNKKLLVCSLKKLDFKGVELDKVKRTATVSTHEEWTFQDIDEKSRQPIGKEEAISYNNVYHLVQEQGHWVVEKVDMNETQTASPKPPVGDQEEKKEIKQSIQPAGKY